MQTTTTPTQTRSTPAWARYVRLAYRITAWLFIVHVAVQVFMAGMITFASPVWRAYHVQSGHMIGFYVLILPLLAVLGRAPRRITILSITVFSSLACSTPLSRWRKTRVLWRLPLYTLSTRF